MSNHAPPLRILLSLVLMTLWGTGLPHDQPLATSASTQEYVETCAGLEECFKGAALPKERLGKTLTKDQVLSLKHSGLSGRGSCLVCCSSSGTLLWRFNFFAGRNAIFLPWMIMFDSGSVKLC